MLSHTREVVSLEGSGEEGSMPGLLSESGSEKSSSGSDTECEEVSGRVDGRGIGFSRDSDHE